MSAPDPKPRGSEWQGPALGVLAAVFAFNLLGRGSGETYTVFLLPLEREFGWSRSQLTGVYATYLLVGGLLAPFVGTLFDRIGPRAVYLGGLGCVAAAYLLASTLDTLWQFYLYAGVMVGAGVALVGMVPGSGLLTRWYHARLSAAIGIAFSAIGCGVLCSCRSRKCCSRYLDWRTTYRALGLVLLALMPIAAFALPWRKFAAGHPEHRRRTRERVQGEGWTLRAAIRTRVYWGIAAMFFFTAVGMFTIMPQTVVYLIDVGFAPVVGRDRIRRDWACCGRNARRHRLRRRAVRLPSHDHRELRRQQHRDRHPVRALVFTRPRGCSWRMSLVFGACQGARGPIISAICTTKFAGPRVATIYGTVYCDERRRRGDRIAPRRRAARRDRRLRRRASRSRSHRSRSPRRRSGSCGSCASSGEAGGSAPCRRASSPEPLHRALVVAEIDVLVGGRRLAAPLTFELRAQREHRPEAFHVEPRVRREAEAGHDELLDGLLGHLRVELETLGERRGHVGPVRRVERGPDRFDIRGEIALEHVGVRLRPGTHHEGAGGLVAADQVERAAEALQSLLPDR